VAGQRRSFSANSYPDWRDLNRSHPALRHTLWDGIEAVLPMATRRVFSRSGHQPVFEEPDEFATVVAEWMKKQDDALCNRAV
jgi:hypothetical protein